MSLQRRTPLGPGKGLARSSSLAPGKPLTRTGELKRATPLSNARPPARAPRPGVHVQKDPPARPRPRKTGPPPAVRALVVQRDRHLCVRCGQAAAEQDHRRPRGMGGTKGAESDRINGPEWLLTLCGRGNTSGCHGWKESNGAEAARLGYKITAHRTDLDAARVPVLTRFGWVRFTTDGRIVQADPPPCGDARNTW